MTTRCKDPSRCRDGNCIGCHNGKLFCNDSNCYPNCQGCAGSVPLAGSRLNNPQDLENDTPPYDTSSIPESTENSFYTRNPLFTIIIVVGSFIIIGLIFYWLFRNLELRSEPSPPVTVYRVQEPHTEHPHDKSSLNSVDQHNISLASSLRKHETSTLSNNTSPYQ